MTLVALLACNHAPSEWPDPGISPQGQAPWGYPTDLVCDERDDADAVEIDGFTFCGAKEALGKPAIDDPIYRPCSDLPDDLSVRVLSVFDGVRARAWPIADLLGRELVNDDWGGVPILVDY